MKKIACVLVVVAFFVIAPARAQVSEVAIGRKQLELGVFAVKKGAEKGSGLAVSPYSMHAALMLLRLGARGAIASEMDSKLLPAPFSPEVQAVYASLNAKIAVTNEAVTSSLANAVWLNSGVPFEKGYVDAALRLFATEPRTVDFGSPDKAREVINEWVSSRTQSLVPHLLSPGVLSERTTCVLVNALYFKSAWLSPFDKVSTRDGEFWSEGSKQVKVPMMSSLSSVGYFESEGWQAVQLPYRSAEFLLVVLVPKQRQAVRELAKAITPALFARAFTVDKHSMVALSLPRFKVRYSTDLVEQLKAFGLTDLQGGDYSLISPRNVGAVGSVIHEAVLSVDEGGTEAAAATAITMMKSMGRPESIEPKKVIADRPFAFALIHRSSSAPLFVGLVGDPREESAR